MKTVSLGLAGCAAALSFAVPATAAETLQVISGNQSFRAVQVASFDPIGQTFTAFSDIISSVGFQFITLPSFPAAPRGPLTLSIFAGEALNGSALFTTSFNLPQSVNNRDTPVWVDVVVPELAVARNQTYSLVLNASTAFPALVMGPGFSSQTGQFFGGDAYAGGKLISTGTTYANCQGAANNCDANFRVTGNLVAAAVPEPGAWAMMIVGFLAVGGAMRATRARRPQLNYV